MKLNVLERLILLSILPKEGDLTTIRLVRQLREALSFTEAEHAVLQFRVQEGNAQWLQQYGEGVPLPDGMTREEAGAALTELNAGAEIDIGITMAQLVKDTLAELDEAGKLTERHISLCEKFEVTE